MNPRVAIRSRCPAFRRTLQSALFLLTISCGDSDTRGIPSITRDSAGIQIVESVRPAWQAGDAWSVSPEPSLTIGREEGDPRYLFHGIVGVQRMSDGRIAVADAGSSEIRFFTDSGEFIASVGRSGEGPGEYRYLSRLWRLPDDSLTVVDAFQISTLDSSGRFVRAVSLEIPEGSLPRSTVGQLMTGEILAISGTRGFGPADAGHVIRDSIRYFWHRPDGSSGAPITVVPGSERWGLEFNGSVQFPYIPFSARAEWAAGPDRFLTGMDGSAEYSEWLRDGSLDRIVRWAEPERAVTDDVKARQLEVSVNAARDENGQRRERKFMSEVPLPATVRVYQSMQVDDLGNVWIERYRFDWELTPEWNVFGPDRDWLGLVRTPERFRIFQIGSDFILGVGRDENDIERVLKFDLARRPSQE